MISPLSPLSAFLGQLIVDSKHFVTAPPDLLVRKSQQVEVQDLHQQLRASDLELVSDNAKIFHQLHPRRATYPKLCKRRFHSSAIEARGASSPDRWDEHYGESSASSLQDSPSKPMGRKYMDSENDPLVSRWAPLDGENPKCAGLICPSRRKNSITDDVVASSPLTSTSVLPSSGPIISLPTLPLQQTLTPTSSPSSSPIFRQASNSPRGRSYHTTTTI
jgi:hypothetical protein